MPSAVPVSQQCIDVDIERSGRRRRPDCALLAELNRCRTLRHDQAIDASGAHLDHPSVVASRSIRTPVVLCGKATDGGLKIRCRRRSGRQLTQILEDRDTRSN
jgi:hypothetical protein